MNTILQQLYNGEICLIEQYRPILEEYKAIRKKHMDNYKGFIEKLGSPLDKEFIKIMDEQFETAPLDFSYVTEGSFVNRGALHGPLLPIYGRGAILILILLKKARKNLVAEFAGIIILSGCMEYFISWYLEMVYDGKRWWDYSEYWLNVNGRICAEGLILFGVGGMFVVYVAAPFLDDKMRKMNPRWLMVFAVVLLMIYAGDSIYSAKYPNTGTGITEYSANGESACLYGL